MSPDASDLQVIREIAAGAQAALGELYDRHATQMLSLGIRIIGARNEAEDVLHDVFLEVWRAAGDYEPGRGSVKTWLLLRMRSRSLDRIRLNVRRRALAPDTDSTAVDPQFDRSFDGARLRGLVGALPDIHRQVMELGYFGGLSFSEIARRLEIPEGTVKSRVSAALIRLRSDLRAPSAEEETR